MASRSLPVRDGSGPEQRPGNRLSAPGAPSLQTDHPEFDESKYRPFRREAHRQVEPPARAVLESDIATSVDANDRSQCGTLNRPSMTCDQPSMAARQSRGQATR